MKRFLTTFLLPLGKQGLLVKRICFISHPFRLAAAGVPALRALEQAVCWAGVLSARRTQSTGPCCGCYQGQDPSPGCCRHHMTMLTARWQPQAGGTDCRGWTHDGAAQKLQRLRPEGCGSTLGLTAAHVVSMQEPNCRCLQITFFPSLST